MVINSRFKDYDDRIRAFGRDPAIVYHRKDRSEVNFKYRNLRIDYETKLGPLRLGNKTVHLDYTPFVIGFSGKIYPGMRVVVRENPEGKPINEKFVYSLRDWTGLLDGNGFKYGKFELQRYQAFFEVNNWAPLCELFQKYKVPIFAWHHEWENDYTSGRSFDQHGSEIKRSQRYRTQPLVLNPQLRPYDFITVKDPPTAFQEIYMFISGVLGVPERPMVQISDIEKAKKHGHDGKYSFRKPPKPKR